jgi:hypothetical protein
MRVGLHIRPHRWRLASILVLVVPVCLVAISSISISPLAAESATGGVATGAAKRNAKLFGISVSPNSPGEEGFRRIKRLGARAVRLHLNWAVIEKTRGVRNWGYFDTLVGDAAAAGLGVMPLLFGVPSWISKDATTPPVRNEFQRSQWRSFVREAAMRYGPGGLFWTLHPELAARPIRVFQSGNEPNLPFFFGGKVGVRRYRLLLKITARALRSVDPGVTVVTAGIFHYKTVPGSLSMKVFLRRFYSLKGVRRWFDVLALHPYSPRPKGVIATIRAGRGIMKASKDGRTPIWISEIGWTTGGTGWRRNAFRATKRQQAKRLKATFRSIRRHPKLRVRRVFWHGYRDFDYPNLRDPWTARMGLLTLKGARKPAWFAYARTAGGTP